MKTIILNILFLLIFETQIFAQTDSNSTMKEISKPILTEQDAPSIELPEFQITGTEFISLPNFSKDTLDEEINFSTEGLLKRNRDLNVSFKEKDSKKNEVRRESMIGKVSGAIGNNSTSAIEGWFGKNYEQGGIIFHAKTNGVDDKIRNANSDLTGFSVDGNLLLNEYLKLNNPFRARGKVVIENNNYNTFGALNDFDRKKNNTNINFGVNSNIDSLFSFVKNINYTLDFDLNFFAIRDSNLKLEEFEFSIGGKTFQSIFNLPTIIATEFRGSNPSRNSEWNFSYPIYFKAEISFQNSFYEKYSAGINLQFISTNGTDGKSLSNFFPQIEGRYNYSNAHSFSLAYNPTISYQNYSKIFERNPYLKTSTGLNPESIPFYLIFKSEHQLSPERGITSTILFEKRKNHLSYIDTTTEKLWQTTEIPSVNHFKFELNWREEISSQNSLQTIGSINYYKAIDSNKTLPHIPLLNLSGIYKTILKENLSLEFSATFSSKRWIDIENKNSLKGFLDLSAQCEYLFQERFKFFGNVTNLINQKIYLWDGYREKGFSILFGMTYSW
mgnify:FL=1